MNIFDLQATISLNSSGFVSGVQEAQGAFNGLGETIKGNALGKLAADAIEGAASGLVDFGKSAMETGMAFDASMANVAAISGSTGETLDALRDKAKEMGATTKFTATEAADAFGYMAMAGWDASQMMDGITGIMNLAAASGEDLATTSDIVTDALTAFGLSAADSAHFADVLAAASSAANTNVSMMGDTFKYVAPVAGALGYKAEDVATAIGLMANSGIKSSQAGTALRGALTSLVKPSDEAFNTMKKLGIVMAGDMPPAEGFEYDLEKLKTQMGKVDKASQAVVKAENNYAKAVAESGAGSEKAAKAQEKLIEARKKLSDAEKELKNAQDQQRYSASLYNSAIVDRDGNMQSFSHTISVLRNSFSQLSEAEQAEAAAVIFGQQAMSGMLAIINSTDEDIDKLSDTIYQSSVNMEHISDKVTNSGVAWEKYSDKMWDAQDIVEQLSFSMLRGGRSAEEMIEYLNMEYDMDLDDAIAAVNAFQSAVEESTGTAQEMADIMNDNLPGSITLLGSAFDAFKTEIYEKFSGPLKSAVDMATDLFSRLAQTLKDGGGIRDVFATLGSFIKEKFTGLLENIELPPAVQNIADKLKDIFNKVRDAIGSLNLGEKFSAAFEGIKSTFDRVRTTISEAVQGWNLPEVFSGLTEKIRGAFDTVRGVVDGLNLGEAFSVVGEKVRGAFEKVREVIGGIDLSGAFSGIAEKVRGAFEKVREAVGGIDFAGIFSGITEKIGGVVGTIRDAIGNIDLSGALGGISEALSGFAGSIRPFIEEKFEKAADIFSSIKSGLGGLIDSFKNVELPDLSGFATGVKNLFGAYELVNETKMGVAVSVIKGFLDAFKSANVAGLISEIAGGAAELFKAFGIAAYDAMEGVVSAVGSFVDAFVDSGALASIIGDIAEGAKNLIGGIMKGSADTISAIGSGIGNFLKAFADSPVADIIAEIAQNAASFFDAIATVTGDVIADIASGIKTFVGGFDNKSAVGIIADLAQWVGDLFGYFSSSIAGIIRAIADSFSGFGDKIAELWNTAGPSLKDTGEAFHAFVDNVHKAIERFYAVVQPVAEWLSSALGVAIQLVVEQIVRIFGNLWNAAMDVITSIQEGFGAFVDLLHGDVAGAVEGFKAAWENIKEFFGHLLDVLAAPFRTLKDVLGDEGNKGVAAIKAPFEKAWEWFKNIGANLIEGLKSGISSAWTGLTSYVSDKFNGLISGVMSIFGEHSPSKVFAGIGANLILGMRKGWDAEFGGFESQVDRDVRRITDTARIGFEDSAIGKSSEAGISSMFAANSIDRGGEPVKINLVLDGDVAATALYDPLRRTAFQKGQGTGGELIPA